MKLFIAFLLAAYTTASFANMHFETSGKKLNRLNQILISASYNSYLLWQKATLILWNF